MSRRSLKVTPRSIAKALHDNHMRVNAAAEQLGIGRTRFWHWRTQWKGEIERLLASWRTPIERFDDLAVWPNGRLPKLLPAPTEERNILCLSASDFTAVRMDPPLPNALDPKSFGLSPKPKWNSIAMSYRPRLRSR